jgi:peptidoglycan/xylan/chitin deacetylase (PgdA/CDA1 family)
MTIKFLKADVCMNCAIKIFGNLLSSNQNKLLIIAYHRVLTTPDPLQKSIVDSKRFNWQMKTLSRQFNVLPLTEAARRLASGKLPSRSVCITFDDGYADNFEVAMPILKKWKLPATFFVSTGFLDGGRMWNDTVIESVRGAKGSELDLTQLNLGKYDIGNNNTRMKSISAVLNQLKYLPLSERLNMVEKIAETIGTELPDNLMMTATQVAQLSQYGMEIGSHTVNHPILNSIPLEQAQKEIMQGKVELEDIISDKVVSFAYPNGRPGQDYNSSHVDAVRKAGFLVSVSTAWGVAKTGVDPLQLPRIGSWESTPNRFSLRLLKAYTDGDPETV